MKKIEKYIHPYTFLVSLFLIGFSLIEIHVGQPLLLITRPCGECPFPQVQYGKIIAGIGSLLISFFPYLDQKDNNESGFGPLVITTIGLIIFFTGVIYALWGWSSYRC